jgi:hypothetical protein
MQNPTCHTKNTSSDLEKYYYYYYYFGGMSVHTDPHSVTTQKTAFVIVTAVKTSNLT